MRPFRKLALVLALIAGVELFGILHTPDYSAELAAAKAAYHQAESENRALTAALER